MTSICPQCQKRLPTSDEPAAFCMYCGAKVGISSSGKASTARDLPTDSSPSLTADLADAPEPEGPTQFATKAPVRGTPAAAAAEGDILGEHRLLRFIGSGGMGTVYEAETLTDRRRVAIKVLSGKLAAHAVSVERFRQEGRVAAQISHPHCVFVYGADAAGGRPYIVMELMPGRTLKDLVDEQGPLPVDDFFDRALDLIDGLTEAHRLGVIHRDVKPSNCFLTADNRVKIGDFGLSKSLSVGDDNKDLTQPGHFLGTVLYAPPEQIRGEQIGYDSDVYSVCATLYFLLVGRAPFQHESLTAALAKAVSETAPPIRVKRPDVPAQLEKIILRGLERDRSRRWDSLTNLRDALLEIHPARQLPAEGRLAVLAYSIDAIILIFSTIPAQFMGQLFSDGTDDLLEFSLYYVVISTVYFTLFDGLLGWSPGKRLLRLRIVKSGTNDSPGLWSGFLRAASLALILFGLLIVTPRSFQLLGDYWGLSLLLVLLLIALANGRLRWGSLGRRGIPDWIAGTAIMVRPRPIERTRFFTRCHDPLEQFQKSEEPLPQKVGTADILGKLCDLNDGGVIWMGSDRALGRRVLVTVLSEDQESPPSPTRPIRPRRLDQGQITWNGNRQWISVAAPTGAPLLHVIDPESPLAWKEALPLLEQLVAELAEPDSLGATIDRLWVESNGRLQILDDPLPIEGLPAELRPARNATELLRQTTTLLLEGKPRSTEEPLQAPLPMTADAILKPIFTQAIDSAGLATLHSAFVTAHQQPTELTTGVRAAHLGIQSIFLAFGLLCMFFFGSAYRFVLASSTAARVLHIEATRNLILDNNLRNLALDQVAQQQGIESSRRIAEMLGSENERVAMAEALRRLEEVEKEHQARAESRLNKFERVALKAFREKPHDVTDELYMTLLLARVDSMPAKVERSYKELASFLRVIFVTGLLIWPLVWGFAAFLFRGGLTFRIAGISIVRMNGTTAERWRCMVRAWLVWSPVVAFLGGALFLQLILPEWVLLRTSLQLFGILLPPLYVAIALRELERPPQDRILGTTLVPQ